MKYFRFLARFAVGFALVFNLVIMGSCISFDFSENSSWAGGKDEKAKGTVRIVSVSAEKSGEWGALEKEVKDLLPLLFFEYGYVTVSPDEEGIYSAEVNVREREYPDGWQTRRSLSAEVKLWAGDNPVRQPLPLSAGRALNNGKKSFASSRTLSAMLRKAIKNAISALPQEGQNTGQRTR